MQCQPIRDHYKRPSDTEFAREYYAREQVENIEEPVVFVQQPFIVIRQGKTPEASTEVPGVTGISGATKSTGAAGTEGSEGTGGTEETTEEQKGTTDAE